ncbi:MAG: phosphatase PAP2 family protein [Actinomycetota bacterium]|nr:phosphatase PAP2 family protein [Actinomycetota bacterium]
MAKDDRPGIIRPLLRLAAAAAMGNASGRMLQADERARARIASNRRPLFDEWMPVLTDLGSVYAVGATAATLWLGGKRRLARDVAGAGMLAWAIAQGAKKAFDRKRPYHAGDVEMLVREPAGTSFPSGHPAVAQAIVGIVAPEIPALLRGPFEALPRMVAFSRVYVGVHYPSDVMAGILVGRSVADLWRHFTARS